jgi:hypothetical protein
MPAKPIELPSEVAEAFVRDMRAFFAAGGTGVKADGIAAMQLHALKQHYKGKLRLPRRDRDVPADARLCLDLGCGFSAFVLGLLID